MTRNRRVSHISDFKTAEAMIAEQRQLIHRLKTVIDEMPGSVYWKDRDGIYLGHNVFSAEKMAAVNVPFKDIIGKTDYDLFSKAVADQYRQNDLKVMELGETYTDEEQVVLENNEVLFQLSCKKPLRDEKGDIVGVIGNTLDITQLKKTEMALREAKEKVEELYSSKDELIKHMEHDIRTPFNGILVLADLLAQQETDLEKKSLLHCIVSSAKNLLNYCNHLLESIKSECTTLPVLEKKFDLKKLIETVLEIESVVAKSKNLELLFEYDPHTPTVVIGDPERMQRVLINLLSNALKFTEKGFVKVKVRLVKKISPKTLIFQLHVEDTGMGISAETQRHLYERFNNLSGKPCPQGGYGLGLPVVKSLVGNMNGEIDLKSELGKGTQFVLTLPMGGSLLDELVF